MKKIITLSAVCLISGQLLAQSSATSATTQSKQQIEAQKQKETSSMSLKQAQDKKDVEPSFTVGPVVLDAKIQTAVAEPVAANASLEAKSKVKVETATKAEIEAKDKTEAKLNAEAKAKQEAAKAATPKKD